MVSDYLLAKPRRAPRIESQRDLTQSFANMQLYYTHPEPVDVSATPIFLGMVRGSRGLRDAELTLSQDGFLPGLPIDLERWVDAQAGDDVGATTMDLVKGGWGYESNFLFLVTDPLLELDAENEHYRLLIEKVTGTVEGTHDTGVSYNPLSMSAMLFGTEMPAASGQYRSDEPSDMMAPSDTVGFADEGRAVPVDVSNTPIHIGKVRIFWGSAETRVSSPYAVRLEGMTAAITDPGSGEIARLDLAAWLERQKSEPTGLGWNGAISEAAIPFELGGTRHLFVLTDIFFSPLAGQRSRP